MGATMAAHSRQLKMPRLDAYRTVAKLYDKRSSAAHGKPSHTSDDVVDSFNLLREVLSKILDNNHVPTKEELESLLFGSTVIGDA